VRCFDIAEAALVSWRNKSNGSGLERRNISLWQGNLVRHSIIDFESEKVSAKVFDILLK